MGECGVYSQWVWGKSILLKVLSRENLSCKEAPVPPLVDAIYPPSPKRGKREAL